MLVTGAALVAMARYLHVAWLTLPHPWQLEWMEGGVVDAIGRLRAGESIYPAPSVDWVGYVYPPLYFVVAAAASLVSGVGLEAARAVSFVAFAGACALAYDFVRAETGERWLGVAAAGLLAASYGASGFWFHLARVDSLALALSLAGIHLLRHGAGRRSAVTAGLVGCAAVLTKQTALLALLPAFVGIGARAPARAVVAGGTLLGATLASALALAAVTDGWFLYYAIDLPMQHELAPGAATAWLVDELPVLLPAVLLALATIALRARSRGRDAWFHAGLFGGFVGSSWLGLAHTGGYTNVLLPAFAALALLVPLAAAELRGGWRLSAALVVPLQIALLWWPLDAAVPPPDAPAQAARFVEWMADQPGEVLVPDLRFLQTHAGHRSHGLGMAARDVLRARADDPGRRMLEESLAHALGERRFDFVVTSQPDWLGGALELTYVPAGRIEGPPPPITGWRETPRWLFRPTAP